jgi:DNA-binding SARP family transcriptional activator/outer membrane protein assembly factor BamB
VDGGDGLRPRELAVLSALTIQRGQPVAADQVAEALWGGEPPPTWPKQVQICVARLRKALGSAAIETTAGGYVLALADDDIDICQFERLVERGRTLAATGEPDRAASTFRRALSLWRGAPFEDLDRWEPARSDAARLAEMRRSLEEDLLDARLSVGEHRDVAAAAETLVADAPLRERRWAILALAQYRCGHQADALRSLQRARRILAEQLGIDPGAELTTLEAAILRQDDALDAIAEPAPARDDCPYKGLAPYDVADAESFFGRDAEVNACLDRLRSCPLLVVAGPSGCGKSSLVRAGLVPAIRRQGRTTAVFTPGSDPDAALTDGAASASGTPVLVIDQFEELFALGHPADEVRVFLERVVAYATERAPVVVAVRSDHLGGLSLDTTVSRLVEQGLHLVSPLAGEALREAIEQPARQAGLRLQDGLTDLLVRDAEGEPGALPLLSHALAETWVRRDGHVLTVEGYRASGGIHGAVTRTAERLYDTLPPQQRLLLRSVLLRLVAPSLDGEPVRSRVPSRTLLGDPDRARIVTLLVRSRLVTSEADSFELAHEALTKAWPRLRGWLDDDAEGQRIWRHVAVTADSWDKMGRPDSELYRGTRLDRAVEWRDRAAPDLTDVERAFLDAGTHARDVQRRQVRRWRRTLTAVLAGGVAVATAFGSFAVVQADRATSERDRALTAEQDAQVSALVNQSLALRSTDRAVAALLAVEAHRRAAPGDARAHSALFGTFTAAPGFMSYLYPDVDGQAMAGAVVPGTATAVVSANGRELQVLDLDTGELEDRFPPLRDDEVPVSEAGDYSIVRVSTDGRKVAHVVLAEAEHQCFVLDVLRVTDDAGCAALSVFDVASGERVLGPVVLPVGPGDLAVNADGSLVAVAGGYDGKVAVYRSGEPVGIVPGMPRPSGAPNEVDTAAVAFGPDGRLYTGSLGGRVRVVDPATLAVTAIYDAPPRSTHNHLTVTQGGLLVGTGDANLVAIDTAAGAVVWSADITIAGDPFPCPYFAVSELMGRFYCGDYYGTLVERELATGGRTGVRLDPQQGDVGELAVGAGGRELVAFGGGAQIVSRWRLDGSGPIVDASLPGWWSEGYDPAGELMLISEGGAVDPPPRFAAWDPETGEIVDQLDPIVAGIWVAPGVLAALFTDGTVGDSYDVRAHTRGDGPPQRGVEVRSAKLSADGTRTYLEGQFDDGSDGRCEVWSVDIATQRHVGPVIDVGPCGGRARDLVASADGSRVAYSARGGPSGDATTLYDGRTGERLAGPVVGLRHTDIGRDGTLYGGDETGGVARYDLDTLEPLATFPQARGSIEALEVSDDGRLLFVGSANQTVSIYDVATRTRLGDPIDTGRIVVDGFGGPVLRPDGNAFAVNGRDGLAIWNIEPDHLAEAACRFAGRNLTRAEWDAFLSDVGPYRATCPEYT